MFNGFDLSTISDAKYGSTQVNEIYCGSTKIWPQSHDYSRDYLTFNILRAGELYFNFYPDHNGYLQYSLNDGATWNILYDYTTDNTQKFNVRQGDKVLWKGNATCEILFGSNSVPATTVDVSGNIMSLLYGDNFIGQTSLTFTGSLCSFFCAVNAKDLILPATTLTQGCYMEMFSRSGDTLITAPELPATTLASNCYNSMFNNCSLLVNAPELPATTLAHQCYAYMFAVCSSLVNAPELPATTLTQGCYGYMFAGCSSLVNAPELPATTLSPYCYTNMFISCTNLIKAPELPATTLVDACYSYMFTDCSSLNYVKCLATNVSTYSCTVSWLDRVNANGDFYKDANNTTWPLGGSGIPAGWNVHNL